MLTSRSVHTARCTREGRIVAIEMNRGAADTASPVLWREYDPLAHGEGQFRSDLKNLWAFAAPYSPPSAGILAQPVIGASAEDTCGKNSLAMTATPLHLDRHLASDFARISTDRVLSGIHPGRICR